MNVPAPNLQMLYKLRLEHKKKNDALRKILEISPKIPNASPKLLDSETIWAAIDSCCKQFINVYKSIKEKCVFC